MSLKLVIGGILLLLSTGCLMTRNDVKETETKQVLQRQVIDLQKNTADSGSRFSEIEEQLRYISGRLEAAETKVNKNDSDADKAIKIQSDALHESNKKMAIYQEALAKLEAQQQQNVAEIASLRAEIARSAKENSKPTKDGKKDSLSTAQELFKQKDWQNAIIEFQKYRDKNSKGKHVPEATYKIGICFQELAMKEDAKTFYQEVIASYPNSEEAKKAKSRLKSLK